METKIKNKDKSPEEQKEIKRKYMEKYINKIGGMEIWKEKIRKAALDCYYKNKEKGIIRARDKSKPKYKPRNIDPERKKYTKLKRSELIDKLYNIEKSLLNQNNNLI